MELITFVLPGRILMAPAWVPFVDWKHNLWCYYLIKTLQYIAMLYESTLGAVVDTEPAGNMILLIGHIRALRMRISKIGWDETKSTDDHYKEFLDCISSHQLLLE